MSLYPELDNRTADELIRFFEGEPIDGPQTAVAFFQEVAEKLAANGLEYLWRKASTEDDARLRAIVLALSRHDPDNEKLRPWLHKLLSGSGEVAAEAIDGLARIADEDAKVDVLAMAGHDSEYVRGAVVRFVCRLAPGEAWPLLEKAASDPSFIVRENAADEMADLGDPRARTWLKQLAADPHPDVRQAAETALRDLDG